MRFALRAPVVLTAAVVLAACSSGNAGSGFGNSGDEDGGTGGNGNNGGNDNNGNGTPPGTTPTLGNPTDGGSSSATCAPNPANYDIPANGCDDDGDGTIDNVTVCDNGLAVTGAAGDFVKALHLCQSSSATAWGVVSASYTMGYGQSAAATDGQHGILPSFGSVIVPREGKSIGVLSSGWAREYDGDGVTSCDSSGDGTGCFKGGVDMSGGEDGAPPNFPKAVGGCTPASDTHDVIDMKISLKVPANAKGFQFDFDFWSGEWPEYVCSSYNDGFVAFLTSQANASGTNISFDMNGNPVSVNNAFFDRCTAGATTGCAGGSSGTATCPGGTAELSGTGFLDMGSYCPTFSNPFEQTSGGGATGWLTTATSVNPGETITLEYVIWDTHDSQYDSSVLLDNFQWIPSAVATGTQRPPVVK